MQARRISIRLADGKDRESIYAIRHQVYGRELRQHAENPSGKLKDQLDEVNSYIVAKTDGRITGFVAITPPNPKGFSIDKYFSRETLPLVFDQGLFEIRLLTVEPLRRGTQLAASLMYAALRCAESMGARTVVILGRLEVLEMYRRAGMKSLGRQAESGSVTYELMSAETRDLRLHLKNFPGLLARFESSIEWEMDGISFLKEDSCYHGGASFGAIGDEFDSLERIDAVINADVLDSWFDPAPGVVEKLFQHLPWALKTSPPTQSEGMCRMVSRARNVPEEAIIAGAGSSDLIYLGLRHWLTPKSRVLILDPMYGEYAHVLEKVVGCIVDRLSLSRSDNYAVNLKELSQALGRNYDWVILVNPNSPTGQHIQREKLAGVLGMAPPTTRFWIDETYVEYAGFNQSMEALAARSRNIVICKSMSKVYALSGVRSAYLCGPADLMDELRPLNPPWAVSLPAQMAACEALRAHAYYQERWNETHKLRAELAEGLKRFHWEILPGCANFLLCRLPQDQPEAIELVAACRLRNLFLRDVANMGKCFDKRMVRIAVKDGTTNSKMLEILRVTLAQFGRPGQGRNGA